MKKVLHIFPDTAMNKGGLAFSAQQTVSAAKNFRDYESVVAVINTSDGEDKNELSARLEDGADQIIRLADSEDKSKQLLEVFTSEKPDSVVFWLPEFYGSVDEALNFIGGRVPIHVRSSTTCDIEGMADEFINYYASCFKLAKSSGGKVICNSNATAQWNTENFKVPPEDIVVIRNAIDLTIPSNLDRPESIKKRLEISDDSFVVSTAAWFQKSGVPDYRKDPFGFMLIASEVVKTYPNCTFVMCGEGSHWSDNFIQSLIKCANKITGGKLSRKNFKALGHTDKIDEIYAISDLLISTAQSEAFGRTIVEAMKHGVISLVTDVGVMPSFNGELAKVIPRRPMGYSSDSEYYSTEESNKAWLTKVMERFEQIYSRSKEESQKDSNYLSNRAKDYGISTAARKYVELLSADKTGGKLLR